MPIEIIIPRLGWSMEEGNFVGWLKKEGDLVKAGEPLFTLENEKATQDVEATDSGALTIVIHGPKPGDIVKVGQVIGHLLLENESGDKETVGSAKLVSHELAERTSPNSKATKTSTALAHDANFEVSKSAAISPRARRVAAELGVQAANLRGSGRTGRVIERDVREAVKAAASPGLSSMRRSIAQRTAQSFSSTPHFYLRSEVDVTALLRFRNELLGEMESTNGVRLTLTDLILRAQARALQKFPAANGVWGNDNIVHLTACDVGLVVAVPNGMRMPIVRSPERGLLAVLAEQRSRLVELARSGKLSFEAMQGGATALSNLGSAGVDEFAAVISPGHSSMLAVGKACPRPFVVDGTLAVRSTLRLCLSVDHRVLDGAPGAEFLGIIAGLLEKPEDLL